MSDTLETDAEAIYPDSSLGECVDADFARKLERERDEAREALRDMLSGWHYIRKFHGDLDGVELDAAQTKAEKVLEGAK
jgi:hypothetical protein